jgi:hypothetical protein
LRILISLAAWTYELRPSESGGNPFTTTMNATIKNRPSQLKAVEFSARPCFYFYSKFLSVGNNWMGNEDLACSTDEELRHSVAKIK